MAERAELRRIDPTVFLAGVIKIYWEASSQLWSDHLSLIHESTTTKHSPETRRLLQTQVAGLHTLQADVLPEHRPTYFFDNVSGFLDKASIGQLRQFVDAYQPAITNSLNTAAERGRRFSTEVRKLIRKALTYQPTVSPLPDASTPVEPDLPSVAEPSHRKRNRRRPPSRPADPDMI